MGKLLDLSSSHTGQTREVNSLNSGACVRVEAYQNLQICLQHTYNMCVYRDVCMYVCIYIHICNLI